MHWCPCRLATSSALTSRQLPFAFEYVDAWIVRMMRGRMWSPCHIPEERRQVWRLLDGIVRTTLLVVEGCCCELKQESRGKRLKKGDSFESID